VTGIGEASLPPCHTAIAAALAADGVGTVPVDLWHTRQLGPFRVTAAPSHDWRGDDQVAWIVVHLDGFTPTDVPATLTPEQAIEAAVILRQAVRIGCRGRWLIRPRSVRGSC